MLPVDVRHHEETMAWLEDSLGHARACGQTKAEELLEIVRAEVEFEVEYARVTRVARVLLAQQARECQETNGENPDLSFGRFGG